MNKPFLLIDHDPDARLGNLLRNDSSLCSIVRSAQRVRRASRAGRPVLVSVGGPAAIEDAMGTLDERGPATQDIYIHLREGSEQQTARLRHDLRELLRSVEPSPRTFEADDTDTLIRFFHGHRVGAPEEIIVSASTSGRILRVTDANLETSFFDTRRIAGLSKLNAQELAQMEIDRFGSFLEWPDAGLELDLRGLKVQTDARCRAMALAETLARRERIGAAFRRVREACGLRQTDIPGLTARQVRRIEKGDSYPTHETLTRMADAHGLDTLTFLERVAKACEQD